MSDQKYPEVRHCDNCGTIPIDNFDGDSFLCRHCLAKQQPTTVRGWLETLPHMPYAPKWQTCKGLGNSCNSLSGAVWHIHYNTKGVTASRYYLGVFDYLDGKEIEAGQYKAYYLGYHAAKSAFEAQKPQGVYTTSETHDVHFEKGGVVLTEKPDLPPIENLDGYDVAHVTICPKELESLRVRAAAWDDFTTNYAQILSKYFV